MKIVLESFMTARPNVFKLLAQCYVELPALLLIRNDQD
jgi:hypothetical protein